MTAALIPSSPEPSIPVIALHASALPGWLDGQDARTRTWVEATGFTARPDSHCLLAGPDGQLQAVLLGVNERPGIWSAAALPLALPTGRYHLQTDWDSATLGAASLGWALGAYQFERYRKAERAGAELVLDTRCDADRIQAQLKGIRLTRDLINTPAQDMMPQHLSAAASTLAEQFGADFREVVGEDLLRENFPVIHAVGRASAHAPRLLELNWGDPAHPRVCLIGKGVCFDSGGLDLKPASGMRLMKKDMGGAAHVLGLASMIMQAGLPLRLRVLIPAVENAVSGDAFRPGDVLTNRAGKTIEIDNTDAEGRLVLCDALSLATEDPAELLIDMATLTGAARVALGPDLPGIFCTRDDTATALLTHSTACEDPLWLLPLHSPYRRWLKSDVADLVNSASGPYAGAITAALFLQEFVPSSQDWVHMDVMAWNTENLPGRPRGGEAMGLRAYFRYLEARYQQ